MIVTTERTPIKLPSGMGKLSEMMCGCINPAVWEWVLRQLKRRASPQHFIEDAPSAEQFADSVFDHLGLTEHGTSLRGAWATDCGKEVIAFLEQYGAEWASDARYEFVDDSGTSHSLYGNAQCPPAATS